MMMTIKWMKIQEMMMKNHKRKSHNKVITNHNLKNLSKEQNKYTT